MKQYNLIRYFIYFSILFSPIHLNSSFIHVNNINQYNQIINDKKPTIIKFAAHWCGVCQQIKDSFEHIAQENEFSTVNFVDIDIDESQSITKNHTITGVPTFIYVHNKKTVNKDVGVQNMNTFADDLRTKIRTTFHLANNIDETNNINSDSSNIKQVKQPIKKAAEKKESKNFFSIITEFLKKIIELIGSFIKYLIDSIRGLLA